MVWQNGPLVLYHGTAGVHATDLENGRPDLAKCRKRRDFGQGFYTTRREEQARGFANHVYNKMRAHFLNKRGPDPLEAAVVEYVIDRNDLGSLDTLAFVFPDDDWRDFVQNCRLGVFDHKGPGIYYDVVYAQYQQCRWKLAEIMNN